MSFPDENHSSQAKPYSYINNAFLDFSQDFNQKYHSHHLIDFPEGKIKITNENSSKVSFVKDNEIMPFGNGPINQNFSQETPRENDYLQSANPLMFNSFDYKEKQASKEFNSNIRLDCSPEIKLGVKGSSRFFSFDPEEDVLNSYWGVKNQMNQSNFNELNEVLQGHEEENLMAEENDFYEASEKKETDQLLEKESANRSSRGIYSQEFLRIC